MFSGLIETQGILHHIKAGKETKTFEIKSALDESCLQIGASLSHSGCCLSIIEKKRVKRQTYHKVQVIQETLEKTTLNSWKVGQNINLETSLKFGDEIGGHLVTGHVDGIGRLIQSEKRGGSHRLTFEADSEILSYIAPKGSICIDGVSLTVVAVENKGFLVDLISHTWSVTTLGDLEVGHMVNLEIDLIARYTARLLGKVDYG